MRMGDWGGLNEVASLKAVKENIGCPMLLMQ